MVIIEASYGGELHTTCRHQPSGCELATDAPVDNQGRGESFSPTDLLATALGSCMLTTMGIGARNEGWELAGTRLVIQKIMAEAPRRVARLALEFEMSSQLPGASRSKLEQLARSCPVAVSIHPDIDVDLRFVWS